MGYIQELRKRVGNQPIIMTGAAVLVMDQQDRLLLLQRTDNGLWGLPGGAMEPGESLQETAKRETKEETGLDVEQLVLFDVFSGPELFYRYPNGAQVHNVTVVYQTHQAEGNLELGPEEHTRHQYFDIEHLPENVSPPIGPILKEVIKRYDARSRAGI